MLSVDKVESFIFNIVRKGFDEEINQFAVIAAFSKLFKFKEQVVTMPLNAGDGGGVGSVVSSKSVNGGDSNIGVWTLLRLKNAATKGHILAIVEMADIFSISDKHLKLFEFIIFAFNKIDNLQLIDQNDYIIQVFKSRDEMSEIRYNIKTIYKTSMLGHMYVINERQPIYMFLKEWYVQNFMEIYQLSADKYVWEAPHVIVFDLDNTLITDEKNVNIRCDFVYDSLRFLKSIGCVLVLWSYGNKSHVTYSMERTNLTPYFDITICEGNTVYDVERTGGNVVVRKRTVQVNIDENKIFVNRSFYVDNNIEPDKRPPKSPRIVLWYLRKIGVNYTKTITLVDDLATNNYSYDYFIHVDKCNVPTDDWKQYHDTIVDNIIDYENSFTKKMIY